jgi:hypothetical protein
VRQRKKLASNGDGKIASSFRRRSARAKPKEIAHLCYSGLVFSHVPVSRQQENARAHAPLTQDRLPFVHALPAHALLKYTDFET